MNTELLLQDDSEQEREQNRIYDPKTVKSNTANILDRRKTVRYAFMQSLPVMAGYIVLGIGFGILLQSKGYNVWWSMLMSTLIYAGSMQYVAVDLMSGGATILASALMTLMVNARHLFYGVSMLERYKDTGKVKPYLIFALTDETYSLVCSGDVPEGVHQTRYFGYVSLMNHCYWVLGSVIGTLAGTLLDFNSKGIDFAMTALFVVIFTEQLEKKENHISAAAGLGISLLCLFFFGASRFLIPAMVGITVCLMVLQRRLEQEVR